MPNYIVSGTDLTSVANAIRTAGGTSGSLTFPSGWVSAIGNLGGLSDFTQIQITVNSNSDSTDYGFYADGFRNDHVIALMYEDDGYVDGWWYEVDPGESVTFNPYIYGTYYMWFENEPQLTGNATKTHDDGWTVEITGNCTITVTIKLPK